MKLSRKVSATSQILQIFIADSSSTTGGGLTGLVFNSAGLTAYYHKDIDTTATAITLVTMTVGTFTSSGFKEIDATNMPGWYQLCLPNAALSSGSSVVIHLKGATNMAPLPIEIDLDSQVDVTHWNGTAVSSPATAGIPDVNVKNIDNDAASASGTVTFPNATLASTTNITAGTITTVTNQLTPAQVATGVWQDATAGDFTVASSIGKSLYTGNIVPGAAGGHFIAGSNAATSITTALTANIIGNVTGNLSGSVGSVTGAVGSVTTRVTANTDQFAGQTITAGAGVTIPSSIASPTNITAGTITTVTNLTNAATNGDFTATMKTSLNASTPASITGNIGGNIIGFVTGDVWGSVHGSVASVGAPVTLTGAYDFAKGTVAMTEAYPVKGATVTPAEALYDILQQMNEKDISGTTLTIAKRDQSTPAKTFTLNDPTNPTAITEAT